MNFGLNVDERLGSEFGGNVKKRVLGVELGWKIGV